MSLTAGADRITGEERAVCRFLTNGKAAPDGRDIRVLTSAGRATRVSVISTEPGDAVEIAFDTVKGVGDYYVYFGNPKAPAPPEGATNRGGLLLEMRQFMGGAIEERKDFVPAFERSQPVIGRKTLWQAQLGMNPFGIQSQTVSRLSGGIYAPAKGDYVFAVAADDRGILSIDGKELVFARYAAADARFQERTYLDRGWHEFTLYHVNFGGEGPFAVYWRRPDMQQLQPIGRESFGLVALAEPGALEEVNRQLTADFTPRYQAECFYGGHYSYRYQFALNTAFPQADRVKCTWDFGDGQTAEGQEVEHVYLTGSVYNVTVSVLAGGLSDKQSFQLAVNRDYEHSDRPATDDPGMQAKLAANYDLQKLPPESLTWGAMLFLRAGNLDQCVAAAKQLLTLPRHPNLPAVQKVMQELSTELPKRGRINGLAEIYLAAPADSDLQPWAACERASLLLWWKGDIAGAMKAIEPQSKADDRAKRIYGQLLILSGQADEGRKVLEELPVMVNAAKQAAISGAMARTTEFYITEGRWEDGEDAWEKWQTQFPASFTEGHSMLLRVELLEVRKANVAAASVAEAFANAMPQSPYAPRLLDRASKLIAPTDADKAKSLRELLKQRYPEDPLSQ